MNATPRVLVLLSLAWLMAPVSVTAQPLGTFRWQLQPFCNVLTLAATQNGAVYRLEGTDDQCGGPQASVIGTAFQNPDGSIGFGLNIVGAPGGAPVHVDATISLATLAGSWRDSAANTGSLVPTPGAATGGNPRPLAGPIGAGGVNSAQVQLRVTGACPVGQLIQRINQDGGVVCEAVGTGHLTHATAIGAFATVSASNSIVLGRSNGLDTVRILSIEAAGASMRSRTAGMTKVPQDGNLGQLGWLQVERLTPWKSAGRESHVHCSTEEQSLCSRESCVAPTFPNRPDVHCWSPTDCAPPLAAPCR